MIIGIVFFFVAEIYFSTYAKLRSDEIMRLIGTINDPSTGKAFPDTYYSAKQVPWKGVIWFDTAHEVLYAILIKIIYSIRKSHV